MKQFNYLKIFDNKNEPMYVLQVEAGSEDEIILMDMLFDNKVKIEKSTEKEFTELISDVNKQYTISTERIIDENNRRNDNEEPPREGREL